MGREGHPRDSKFGFESTRLHGRLWRGALRDELEHVAITRLVEGERARFEVLQERELHRLVVREHGHVPLVLPCEVGLVGRKLSRLLELRGPVRQQREQEGVAQDDAQPSDHKLPGHGGEVVIARLVESRDRQRDDGYEDEEQIHPFLHCPEAKVDARRAPGDQLVRDPRPFLARGRRGRCDLAVLSVLLFRGRASRVCRYARRRGRHPSERVARLVAASFGGE